MKEREESGAVEGWMANEELSHSGHCCEPIWSMTLCVCWVMFEDKRQRVGNSIGSH